VTARRGGFPADVEDAAMRQRRDDEILESKRDLPHQDRNLPPEVRDETGDESSPRPDENVVDELGEEVGVEFEDAEPLRPIEKVAERDERRWELDPASSLDYEERNKDLKQD
jgi:hypothetical protein